MRIMLASVVLLMACGAESPSGSIPTTDAATDTPPAPADATQGMCLEPRVILYGGVCGAHTDDDCNGVRCPADQQCSLHRRPQLDGSLPLEALCFCRSGKTNTRPDGGFFCDPPHDA